jgi:hypothetical protein
MITVTLTFKKTITQYSFPSLTEALVFARSSEVGTSFQIREGKTLLAKGKIEDLRGDYK